MNIGELPIGSILRFGRFDPIGRGDIEEIDWIKVSNHNEFISKKVLICMKYDEREGWNLNYNYELSNIRQFINSESAAWYLPQHESDKPTTYIYLYRTYTNINAGRFKGLLHHFYEEEISAIDKFGSDYMRLPSILEISGGFPYFRKRGKRANPIDTYGEIELPNYTHGMFASYYVTGQNDCDLHELSRSGSFDKISPFEYSGVRPVCRLSSNVTVIPSEDVFILDIPKDRKHTFFKETHSIDWLLS